VTEGLKRRERKGQLHFVTFSCWGRKPYLSTTDAKDIFEDSLRRMAVRYGCPVIGYVVMPEHVHLLLGEPHGALVGEAVQALKLSVTRRSPQRPFWLARYYDFNIYSEEKRAEKLKYMHRNPATRGLVDQPEDWAWSSYQYYQTGIQGRVKIASLWSCPFLK
jgi:putative transposase